MFVGYTVAVYREIPKNSAGSALQTLLYKVVTAWKTYHVNVIAMRVTVS